jgi:hypothetical protein
MSTTTLREYLPNVLPLFEDSSYVESIRHLLFHPTVLKSMALSMHAQLSLADCLNKLELNLACDDDTVDETTPEENAIIQRWEDILNRCVFHNETIPIAKLIETSALNKELNPLFDNNHSNLIQQFQNLIPATTQ